MSNIDKRALREAAEKAIGAHERLSVMPPDDIFDISLAEGTQLDADITALNALNSAANPATVLSLLDELEAKDVQITNLTAERDALREGEMGDAKHSNTRAAADIYFQLVEECEVPAGGSLVEYVSELRERAAMLQGADGNSPVIPDGWAMVPVEPTYQMCEAMGLPWESPRFPDRYKAMIAAAPHFREIVNSSTNNCRENAETSTKCWCHTCRPVTISDMRFVVCPECGNKRCPHANDHRHACTGNNEPGQEGSAYPAAPQQEVAP